MGKTSIQWTDSVWNPVRGCTRVSPGCINCYAEVMAARFSKPGMWGHGIAAMKGGDHRWTGKVELIESMLTLPLSWKKPRRIFVNSTSDLFHESLSEDAIDRVFTVMALCRRHTFQILTKRPDRMLAYMERLSRSIKPLEFCAREMGWSFSFEGLGFLSWSIPNVWLGTSVEDNERARERIPLLQVTPAAIRFISAEPLLEDLEPFDMTGIHQVIVGGESGPGARPFYAGWARNIVRRCKKAHVACFVKQMGSHVRDRSDAGFEGCSPTEWPDTNMARIEHDPDGYSDGGQGAPVRIHLKDKKGGDMAEWPEDLCVREMPPSNEQRG